MPCQTWCRESLAVRNGSIIPNGHTDQLNDDVVAANDGPSRHDSTNVGAGRSPSFVATPHDDPNCTASGRDGRSSEENHGGEVAQLIVTFGSRR